MSLSQLPLRSGNPLSLSLSVILKLSDAKEKVRALSSAILENIASRCSSEVILPVLLKVTSASNPKVRLGAIEYMMHVISFSQKYFDSDSVMKLVIILSVCAQVAVVFVLEWFTALLTMYDMLSCYFPYFFPFAPPGFTTVSI